MAIPSRLRLRRAVVELKAGATVAYPTEAVYGLGCDPWNPNAVARVMDLKGRPKGKSFILIAADLGQLGGLIAPLDEATRERLQATWPGPVTWVVPAAVTAPAWLLGSDRTLAVRVTAHPLAAALCRAFGGALISTSANPSGKSPARSALRVRRYFGTAVGLLAGPLGRDPKPTAIYDVRSGRRLR